jgi:hypothetical protein
MIKVFSMLRTLFHNGWSYAKIRSNQGYVGKVRAPARARSRARKLGYARGSFFLSVEAFLRKVSS